MKQKLKTNNDYQSLNKDKIIYIIFKFKSKVIIYIKIK